MADELEQTLGAENPLAVGKKSKAEKSGERISMSVDDLSAIVAAAVQNAVTQSSQILADAIKDSKKPYTDPRQEENDRIMREQMREVKARMDASIKASQGRCPHLQGCNDLSEFSGQLTSIVQHQTDTGQVIGICTNCQRVFKPSDPDYITQMQRKSGNRMSRAGQRLYLGQQPTVLA